MTTAFYILVAFFLWSAGIYGFMELTKRSATALGRREERWFVRALPVLPLIVGGLTGLIALPSAAAELGLDAFVVSLGDDPIDALAMGGLMYFLVGTVPGALAGQAFKVLKQTISGADFRIKKK